MRAPQKFLVLSFFSSLAACTAGLEGESRNSEEIPATGDSPGSGGFSGGEPGTSSGAAGSGATPGTVGSGADTGSGGSDLGAGGSSPGAGGTSTGGTPGVGGTLGAGAGGAPPVDDPDITDDCIEVDSLEAVMPYLDDDGVCVIVAPGTYTIGPEEVEAGTYGELMPEFTNGTRLFYALMRFSGSNSTYIFTDVTINVDKDAYNEFNAWSVHEMHITGNNNIVKNFRLANVNAQETGGGNNLVVDGRGNRVEGFHIASDGSYPYAYGDAFGKGGGAIISHDKHSTLLLRGDDNHIKSCTIIHRVYGHAIYLQGAVRAVVENCYIEGEMRSTDEMLAEEGTGSAADDEDFMTEWGYRLPSGFMMSLAEEGIRAYRQGTTLIDGEILNRRTNSPTAIDNVIKFMRTAVNFGAAEGTSTITGCTAIGCEFGFSGSVMTECTADVSYGPAFELAGGGSTVDMTLNQLFEPYNGSGRAVYIAGSGHNVTLRSDDPDVSQSLQVVVGGGGNSIRHQPGSVLDYQVTYEASDITVNNLTNFPVLLSDQSEDTSGLSCSSVTDNGSGNSVEESSSCGF